jgi:hypothetical protein
MQKLHFQLIAKYASACPIAIADFGRGRRDKSTSHGLCDFAQPEFRAWPISLASVVMEITTPKEIPMSTKLKIAVVAVLLLASAPTAFAQRAPAGQGSATISHTSQDSGPFANMSRPE